MKINEVEAMVGITKKNIRFYEQQGLLTPVRNSDNGYREYTQREVDILRKIKILRKLDVPIEEIRQMLSGNRTVADGMRRHLIVLQRQQKNLEQSVLLCKELQNSDIHIDMLDSEELLRKMEDMEKSGTSFSNTQKRDVTVSYVSSVIVTVLTVALMVGLSALILWAYRISPEEAPPVWFLVIIIGLFACVAVGVIFALIQRLREIVKGEIDDARHY